MEQVSLMRRRLFAPSVMSLVVFLATAAALIASYAAPIRPWYPSGGNVVHLDQGSASVGSISEATTSAGPYAISIQITYSPRFSLPLWPVLLVTAVLPVLWMMREYRRRRGRRRTLNGLCAACGYSVTGNTSGTCPECGTPIPLGSDAGT